MNVESKLASAIAIAALAVLPAAALASDSPTNHAGNGSGGSPKSGAQAQCRSERTSMGTSAFDALYGTNRNQRNAFGKCVSKRARQDAADQSSAQSTAEQNCRSERSTDPTAFTQKYGTNKNGKNAFGKCVSGHANTLAGATEAGQTKALENAAKACRGLKSSDPAGFAQSYGTARNAFGKCVSQHAKAQGQSTNGS